MNVEVKEKWLKALRGGEFKQGRERLCDLDDNSYCCLGVLCEIAVAEGVIERTSSGGYGVAKQHYLLLSQRRGRYNEYYRCQ